LGCVFFVVIVVFPVVWWCFAVVVMFFYGCSCIFWNVDQIGFLDLQPARLLPSPSLREFLYRVLFLSSTLHQGASQLGAAGNNCSSALCLLGGQAAVLWLTKFILWLLCQTKECF